MAPRMPSTAGIRKTKKRFEVGQKIGGGTFGVLHEGKDLLTKEPVAIKFELKTIKNPQLTLEY